MTKLMIANESTDLNVENEGFYQQLKAEFVKKCLLSLLAKFIKLLDLPPELIGFILHLESEIKKTIIAQFSDQGLALWLEKQAFIIAKREELYHHWCRRTPASKKLSVMILQLKSRLFAENAFEEEQSDESKTLTALIMQAKKDWYDKIKLEKDRKQKEIICQIVQRELRAYQQSYYWPISRIRHEQQHELLLKIEQAPNARAALQILDNTIMQIEQQYILKSFPANIVFFSRKSRLVKHLSQALYEIKHKLAPEISIQKTPVESAVEEAINHYLLQDVVYHNRQRRYLTQQLLLQLREDAKLYKEQDLQRQYQMRTTLDDYIQKIDEQFNSSSFWPFYFKKRSRLSLQLEAVKQLLIYNQHLPDLELNKDIIQPIVEAISAMSNDVSIAIDIQQDMNTLCQALLQAKTPHAIEAMLEGHIRSYFQLAQEAGWLLSLKNLLLGQDNIHFAIAIKLEHALLTWQRQGLLPCASGYKTFLQTLGEQRQVNENEITRLEQQYHIKIPHRMEYIKPALEANQDKARLLLKRVKGL